MVEKELLIIPNFTNSCCLLQVDEFIETFKSEVIIASFLIYIALLDYICVLLEEEGSHLKM